jgi:protein-tyrosine phosphatase
VTGRHILLEGNLNLRDLGGYETVDGRRVRSGCVFRSDELHALTDADLVAVSDLGIRVVFDLRNHSERVARPNRLPGDVEVLERVSPPTGGDALTPEQQIASGALPEPDDEHFTSVYMSLFDRLAPELRIILERAADAPARPLLFHCAAGKDRTGIAAALLLGLLGVPEDVILDDYELTSTYFTPRRMDSLAAVMTEHGVADERVRPLLEARRPVMASALQQVRRRWGGLDGYARDHLEVEADLTERLRDALLVSPDDAT